MPAVAAATSDSFLAFAGRTFSEMGGPLFESLQCYLWSRHGKIMTMAKDSIFPLPLEGYPGVHPQMSSWLGSILLALNSLYGAGSQTTAGPTTVQKRLVSSVVVSLERMWGWTETVPRTGFGELFDVKGVDYRGEEVKLAKSFNWACIAGALPQEVGTLNLLDFCTGGCRHYVEAFEEYFLPDEQQTIGRPPRILVDQSDWFDVCKGLIGTGICGVLPQRLLHHVGDIALENGLFAVSKNEFDDSGLELHRLIMNMVPLNKLCRSLRGDIGTLPSIAGFSAFYLDDSEVAVMCSEDIKCFYYLFKVPDRWMRFMGFAREVPSGLVPPEFAGQSCRLVARVLPMGFVHSVALAQHIHRNVVRWSSSPAGLDLRGHCELRRDRPAPLTDVMFRVYLDNRDEIRKVDRNLVDDVLGSPSPQQLCLRQEYEDLSLPRHPKKAVESACRAEIQGALLDGRAGVAYAKPEKILKYMGLAWELVQRDGASMRELQVVAGGFVYITMFRRALLCALNEIWEHIESMKAYPPVVRLRLPRGVKLELLRFMSLVPLAQMDFRMPMCPHVTASDASSSGGGICRSIGLAAYG